MGNCCAGLMGKFDPKQMENGRSRQSGEGNSDTVWEKKLPKHYEEILAKTDPPVTFDSKKELYTKFCDSILIEGGTQRILLDKSTGKLSYMLSAKTLDITWGGDNQYWMWVSNNESRFEQVAELKEVWWFEVWQRIDCTLLSPNTEYSVAFVLNIDKTRGKSYPSPFTFSLKTIDGDLIESASFLDDLDKSVETVGHNEILVRNGENRWKEFVVGDFVSKEHDSSGERRDIEVCIKNIDCNFPKSGIVIDGVKINPKLNNQLLGESTVLDIC